MALHGLLLAGNYSYHIHELAAAGEGYCAYTKGHWDPFGATAPGPTRKACAGGTATDCEVGDLSGKHGQLAGSGTSASLVSASYVLTLAGGMLRADRLNVVHDLHTARVHQQVHGQHAGHCGLFVPLARDPRTGRLALRLCDAGGARRRSAHRDGVDSAGHVRHAGDADPSQFFPDAAVGGLPKPTGGHFGVPHPFGAAGSRDR